jgi:hypothetical protein
VTKLVYLVCLTSGLALAACGASPVAGPDGGTEARRLDPVNTDSLGLAFGERQTLEVRYARADGSHLGGEVVSFSLVADDRFGENSAGATVSDAEVLTDDDGIARASVTAGAGRGMFRVRAVARFAPVATFYVSVSDAGFVALDVTPRRVGFRRATDFGGVEIRLYSSTCGAVLPLALAGTPPETSMPPRTAASFDVTVAFPLLPVDMGIAVLGYALAPEGAVLAAGCVDLAAAQLRPATTLAFDLVLSDAPLAYGVYDVTSVLDLTPQFAMLGGEAWRVAPCPRGGAQALLDCALDALDADDDLDCVIESPGTLANALAARRGTVDAEGCRPAAVAGQPSLDALVQAALEGNAGAPARSLPGLAALLADLLDELAVGSRLAPSTTTAAHTLRTVGLELGGVEVETSLTETARPLLEATTAFDATGGQVTLGEHGFTLALAPLARAAFASAALVPAGITIGLGTAMTDAAKSGALNGCAAVSNVACTAIGQATGCLTTACSAGRAPLDARYDAPFAALDASGIDFTLRGAATAMDMDRDVAAESIADGTWDATIMLFGVPTDVTGIWTAIRP